MVGLQALQRLVELPQADLLVAAVRADLGHQEDLVAPALEGLAHPLFALAVVVLPGVVEEVDAGIDRLVNDGDGFLEGRGIAQAVAAQPDDRDRLLGAPERLVRDLVGAGVAQLELGRCSWARSKDSDRAKPAPSRPAVCRKSRRSGP